MNGDGDTLFETYKLHADLAERAAALREEFTKLYTGAVSAIIAAGVLLHRLSPDKGSELAWVLPTLGAVVSVSWLLSFWSITARLAAKQKTLVELEKELSFDFLQRENKAFAPWLLRRKVTGSIMPVSFFAICAVWFYAVLP